MTLPRIKIVVWNGLSRVSGDYLWFVCSKHSRNVVNYSLIRSLNLKLRKKLWNSLIMDIDNSIEPSMDGFSFGGSKFENSDHWWFNEKHFRDLNFDLCHLHPVFRTFFQRILTLQYAFIVYRDYCAEWNVKTKLHTQAESKH